eukprot:1182712-Rhodomonas_salina.4
MVWHDGAQGGGLSALLEPGPEGAAGTAGAAAVWALLLSPTPVPTRNFEVTPMPTRDLSSEEDMNPGDADAVLRSAVGYLPSLPPASAPTLSAFSFPVVPCSSRCSRYGCSMLGGRHGEGGRRKGGVVGQGEEGGNKRDEEEDDKKFQSPARLLSFLPISLLSPFPFSLHLPSSYLLFALASSSLLPPSIFVGGTTELCGKPRANPGTLRPSYAAPGPGIVHFAIFPVACYAMSSTDAAYDAICPRVHAVCSTDIACCGVLQHGSSALRASTSSRGSKQGSLKGSFKGSFKRFWRTPSQQGGWYSVDGGDHRSGIRRALLPLDLPTVRRSLPTVRRYLPIGC